VTTGGSRSKSRPGRPPRDLMLGHLPHQPDETTTEEAA
jgi:hypothetical protein